MCKSANDSEFHLVGSTGFSRIIASVVQLVVRLIER